MKPLKQWLSGLLALCMALSLFPIQAEARTTSEMPTMPVYTHSTSEVHSNSQPLTAPAVELVENEQDRISLLNNGATDYRQWSQGDSRWGSIKLGSSSRTVSSHGCLVTSVTKLIIQAGFRSPDSFDVGTFVRWMNNHNGFSGANMYWAKPSECVPGFTNHGHLLNSGSYSSSNYNNQLIDYLRQGYHLVLAVKNEGHWVAVDEARSLATGTIYIMDSLSSGANADITLASRYPTFNVAHGYKGGSTPDSIANLGDDFYAPILNKEHWKIIENNNGVVQTANETGTANQLWRFQRQSDGSYKISNCQDGRCLDVANASNESGAQVWTVESNDTNAQRWYIYEESGGYILRAKCTNCVLDLPNNDPVNGNRLQMYTKNGTNAQVWAIYRGDECQLKGPTLSVQVGDSVTATKFTWNEVYGERGYDLKIWKDTLWEGDPYHLKWGATSGYEVILPEGTYHAYVDAGHEFECKMSNVVTFTINAGNKAHPMIRTWMSDSEFGDTITDFKVGNRYYFCCRLYDKNTDRDLDEVSDYDYTVKLTIYKPDGSVLYSCDPIASDTYWISCFYSEPGTYTREVILDGYFNYTDTKTFTVEDDPKQIHASTNSVYLNLTDDDSEVIHVWTSGYHIEDCVLSWSRSNDNIGCSWGEWENGLLPLTVTAYSPGTSAITLSVKEKESQTVLHSITVDVFIESNEYTIRYDANGGSGAPSAQIKQHGEDLRLSTGIPDRFGYNFLGWSTNSTASAASYYPGGNFFTDADTTLYAVWQSATDISSGITNSSYSASIPYEYDCRYFTFTPSFSGKVQLESVDSGDSRIYLYDASGNEIASDDDSGEGNNFLLTHFVTSGTKYYAKVKYYGSAIGTINFNVKRTYTINYDANGGSGAPSAQTKLHGTDLVLSSDVPTRSGYDFFGWSREGSSSINIYGPGNIFNINADTTLYAIWITNCDSGHSYSYSVTQEPTTSASGMITGVCSRCNDRITVALPNLNTTDYRYAVTQEATCTGTGTARYTWRSTDYGNFHFDVAIPAVGHNMGSWTIEVPATCIENGTERRECTRCEHHETQMIAATGHDFVNGICTRCKAVDPNYPDLIASGASGALTWSLGNDGILTFTGSGNMKNYGYKSEMPWYAYRDQIKSVVLENGVTSIGAYAFYGMGIESIEIPESVTSIGDYAFKNAAKLDGVILPENLTSLGESAFYACTSLTGIDIPAKLYTVKPYTFKNCTGLEEVTFHEGNLMKISDGAFYNTGLTELVLPDCLDILDSYSFKNCAGLEHITIGSGLTEIREAVFYATAIHEITIPDGITKIGSYAFKNCVKLETIDLPETLTSVGEASFYACTDLETLDLPDRVTKIGNYAFRKCVSLTEVHFGSGLVNIGESSFYGCENLIVLEIPEHVEAIQGYAFKGCIGLIIVSLPDSLKTLGDSAFHTCTSLGEITIPSNVTQIGDYCFSGSTGLDSIRFIGNAPTIGSCAFNKLTATVYYPGNNATWNSGNKLSYGGSVIWISE